MRIKVCYMLWLRDKVGADCEDIEVSGSTTLSQLIMEIMDKHPVLGEIIGDPFSSDNPFILTLNGRTATRDQLLREGDTVKILPPVSGG